MLYQRYFQDDFCPELPNNGAKVSLTAYCRKNIGFLGDAPGRWGLIICPGGGYRMVSPTEGESIALEYLARGIQTFVLRYSVAPEEHPRQILELAAAVSFVRKHARQFNIDHVAVCGFSAGGHLAASLCNLWRSDFITNALGGSSDDYRPDAAILGYPVISTCEAFGPRDCIRVILGDRQIADYPELSLENSVTEGNPPTYLWCTVTDPRVPMENTLSYLTALHKAGVPVEAHFFPTGPHGMSTATADSVFEIEQIDPHVAQWMPLSVEWMKGLNIT